MKEENYTYPKYANDKPSVSELYLKRLEERNIFDGNFFERFNNSGGGSPIKRKDGTIKTSLKQFSHNNIDQNVYYKYNNDNNLYNDIEPLNNIMNSDLNTYQNQAINDIYNTPQYLIIYNNDINYQQQNVFNGNYFQSLFLNDFNYNIDKNYLRKYLPERNRYDQNYVRAHTKIMKEKLEEQIKQQKKKEEKELFKIKKIDDKNFKKWKKSIKHFLEKNDKKYHTTDNNNISSNAGTGKMKFIRKYDYNEA